MRAMFFPLPAALAALLAACAAGPADAGRLTPGTGIVITEEVPIHSVDPADELADAVEALVRGDRDDAADEIRDAADYVEDVAEEAKRLRVARPLREQARELRQLARRIEAGAPISARAVDGTFARTDVALARHFRARADLLYDREEYDEAREALRRAAAHLLNAAAWSGVRLDADAREAIREACVLTRRPARALEEAPERFGSAVDRLGSEIERFGRNVERRVR